MSEKGYDIKLVTPEYFDSSLDLTFMTLSQGGAGDVAISSAIDVSVPIYSVADGVKTLPRMRVEDQTEVKIAGTERMQGKHNTLVGVE